MRSTNLLLLLLLLLLLVLGSVLLSLLLHRLTLLKYTVLTTKMYTHEWTEVHVLHFT